MKQYNTPFLAVLLAAPALFLSTPARADGDVRCNSGPQQNWKPMSALKKQAWLEGWTVQKAQIEGDCYEVYARTENGQAVEAFFHPVTLQKLLVLRRGREIYRAPGFTN
ncbi:PepSY domain-containing protein [Sphingobium subterraneum]|uniref:PepSY domain-containing protein n=1 Tax=Sphingobium subterraneum TaxID=627688 RepID=A0A841J144_9SPHN|nr:PepSY domain-containing protein [Sphingobium subterraneum]MBB6122395.1 hypothetical protein [Sphingobium subterraneum]